MTSPSKQYLNAPRLTAAALAVFSIHGAHAQQQQPVLQEIRVSASRAQTAGVGGFGDTPLADTPASISVITREQMQDLRIRTTTDAARFDASVNDAYNAVGYAEQFSIRGFELDNATSYRKDGLAIPADASIPLENKERIEILKGLAGVQAGVAAPGGIINYVVKRPTAHPLHSLTVEVSERGTLYGALDVGGHSGEFGYRVNLASERMRSYVKGADGERQFASGAFDWRISPRALLQVDLDYQYKSQLTVPGFQLIGGVSLPRVAADTMLNNQPWSKPVATWSGNAGLRFEYQLDDGWRATVTANRHRFKRHDYAAFPYGCTNEFLYPGYCTNGDYDVYDYQSTGERQDPGALDAMLQGRFATGPVQHVLTLGVAASRMRNRAGADVYETGSETNFISNIYRPVVVPPSRNVTGPVVVRLEEHERAFYAHDVLALTERLSLHAGARVDRLEREQWNKRGVHQSSYDGSTVLPNAALVYSPQAGLSLYGAYSVGLEHGGTAPVTTVNANQVLDAAKSRQVELGAKAELGAGLSASFAAFDISKPLETTDAANRYVRRGDARHRGAELAAQGRVNAAITLGASLAYIDATQRDTGVPGLDGKRVVDVPRVKSSVYGDWTVAPGVRLQATWQHAGRKAFDPENTVLVPGYDVLNLGAAYATSFGGVKTILRANVDNVTDKFYWRDVTQAIGGYLLPGAPRVFKLSAQFDW
jgi:iron complex outermembrane receptor protein